MLPAAVRAPETACSRIPVHWPRCVAVQCTEADGFAGVYPEHKFKIVEALQSKGQLIGMTGERAWLVCGMGQVAAIAEPIWC